MDSKKHWESIYTAKAPDEVSWFQREPKISLQLIRRVAPGREAAIIDVGGGASNLVDSLISSGYRNITVLDIALAGLSHAQTRLGRFGRDVRWICTDILQSELPIRSYDVWHDRAVFHFLTSPQDRKAYVEQVARAVRPNGYVIVATFAEDGPTRCSGLDVTRYNADNLHAEFGSEFKLIDSLREEHITPSGAGQSFQYCLCTFKPAAAAAA
jgi:2-polyprenyl-3-methyl-5-hydroxy-6-metoxy-1,4-benzoquinol methylase